MHLKKPRILIADDEVEIREGLIEFLEHSYEIVTAKDGIEALQTFKKGHFDLVLTDLNMPKMNGVELCRQIKLASANSYVPVVLLTGMFDEEHELEGFEAGADDFLAKPFSRPKLLAKCKVMTRIKYLHDQLESMNSQLEKRVQKQVVELQKVNQLKKYFSPNVIRQIIDDEGVSSFGAIPIRKEVTIMFCDIRNFSKVSGDITPAKVKKLLDSYLQVVTEITFNNKGTINKFLGDGALAVFGDFENDSDHCMNAINTALQLKERINLLKGILPEKLREYFKIGFGIHTGPVVLGNIGSGEQVDYTVVGPAVNLAARLQAFSTQNNVIVTESSVQKISHLVETCNERHEMIRGFKQHVKICEVTSIKKSPANKLGL